MGRHTVLSLDKEICCIHACGYDVMGVLIGYQNTLVWLHDSMVDQLKKVLFNSFSPLTHCPPTFVF